MVVIHVTSRLDLKPLDSLDQVVEDGLGILGFGLGGGLHELEESGPAVNGTPGERLLT